VLGLEIGASEAEPIGKELSRELALKIVSCFDGILFGIPNLIDLRFKVLAGRRST
jgi:hypothetical protein